MKRYQYKIVFMGPLAQPHRQVHHLQFEEVEKELNQLGKEGYEVAFPVTNFEGSNGIVLKRKTPKAQISDPETQQKLLKDISKYIQVCTTKQEKGAL